MLRLVGKHLKIRIERMSMRDNTPFGAWLNTYLWKKMLNLSPR